VVKYLVENGANTEAKDRDNKSAVDLTENKRIRDLLKVAKKGGKDSTSRKRYTV
jgi:hypothetical protein